MKLVSKSKNAGLPMANRPSPSALWERGLFDLDPEFFPSRLGVNVPSVNIKETAKEYELDIAAPGLDRKDFNIEVDNHTLCISAEKEDETMEKENGYTRKEYSFNSFYRSFDLPENVKEGDIAAKYENGILIVTVPKAKAAQTQPGRKVNVS